MEQKDKICVDKKIAEGLIKNLDKQIILATKKVLKHLAKFLCGSLAMVASWFLLTVSFPDFQSKIVEYIKAGLIASTSISTFYAAQQLVSTAVSAKKLCAVSSKKEKLIEEVSVKHEESCQLKEESEIKEEIDF